MKRLSISRAWDEARGVLARDRGPIATVALALLVLPGTLSGLVVPGAAPGEQLGFGWSLLSLVVLLISVVGQLTVSSIALGQRQSVGEAIAHAFRRAGPFLVAMLAWLLPFLLVLTPFVLQVQANPTSPPPTASLIILLVALAILVIAVRFLLTTPVAVAERTNPFAILKRSWSLTAGNWWRLFGFLLLYIVAALIVLVAVTSVTGTVVGLIAGEPERMSVGALVVTLISQLVAAAITVLLTVMVTRLYAQAADAQEPPASVPHAP